MLNAAFQIVMRGEDKEDRAAAQGRSFNAIFAMPCSPAMALKPDIGADVPRGPSRAIAQSRCAPARCAGARAERSEAVERTALAGWQVNTINKRTVGVATDDQAQASTLTRPATSAALITQ